MLEISLCFVHHRTAPRSPRDPCRRVGTVTGWDLTSQGNPRLPEELTAPADTPSIPAAPCTPRTGAGLHVSADDFHLAEALGLS